MLGYEIVLTELLVRTFNTVEVDFHTPDLNFSYNPSSEKLLLCFLLLKSYVLLKLRSGNVNNNNPIKTQALNPISFWLTLWPALRRLLDLIEPSTLFMVSIAIICVDTDTDKKIFIPVWQCWIVRLEHVSVATAIPVCFSQRSCHDQCIRMERFA